VETVKLQTWAACGCLVARSKSRVRGLSLRPTGCELALSVTHSAAEAAVCGLWRYTSDGPLNFTFYKPQQHQKKSKRHVMHSYRNK